jgi:type IV pilus assembly protein PilN
VILVNLLPHREAARKRRREVFFATLGMAALMGGLICGAVYSWYLAQIEGQRSKNTFLETEITRLEGQIKDIATLQEEIAALRARQNAVEDLQGNRNLPVYLLSELVKQLPDGVYINSHEAGKPDRADQRRGPIQRTGLRTSAQSGQQQSLVDQARIG